MPPNTVKWDEEYDVVVVGSGAGALVAALAATKRGLSVALIEKTDLYGGTTAYSGGGMWFPNNEVEINAGVADTPDLAREYLAGLMGDVASPLMDAYLEAGPQLVAELMQNPDLDFWWMPFPDYYHTPGSLPRGRGIFPEEQAAVEVADLVDTVREPLWPPTDPLIWGHSMVARFLKALTKTDAVVRRGFAFEELVLAEGRVVGIRAESGGESVFIRAEHGVLLACGGFDRDREMRQRYQAPLTGEWSLGAPGNTGDGIRAGIAIGAATDLMDQSWWTPGLLGPTGGASFLQGLHGGVIVNGAGERYANECLPYDRFGREMLKGQATGVEHLTSHIVFDQELLDTYGIPGSPDALYPGVDLAPWFDGGYLTKADTLEELAQLIGVPGDALVATVDRFNGFAKVGVDTDFQRGEDPYDLFFVAPVESINGTLKQIRTGPFYAAKVVLSDLGTKGGLVCDEKARVQDLSGDVIPGLYAAGNTMAAWSGEFYFGPGVPIGSSAAFAYLAVLDMAQRSASNTSPHFESADIN